MKRELPRPCLMLVTEPHPDLVAIVAAAVAGGVNVVQWRERVTAQARDYELWNQCLAMREASREALLIANGPRVNETSDGWHRRSHVPYSGVVNMIAQTWLVSHSVHSVAQAVASAQSGSDYLVAGTIYASQSHPDIAPQGVDYLREVCAAVRIPVIAIGGITPGHVGECIQAGAAGVAVLSPIMRAQDPQAAAREYADALQRAWKAKQCS